MSHKIRVACVGEGELVCRVTDALIAHEVIPPENLFLSAQDGECALRNTANGAVVMTDDANTVVKAEIIVVAARQNELATAIAPICGCTTGRVVIAMSDKVDCAYVSERVARGTQIMAVEITEDADGALHAKASYTPGFPEYLKPPCVDIVHALADGEL